MNEFVHAIETLRLYIEVIALLHIVKLPKHPVYRDCSQAFLLHVARSCCVHYNM